MLRYLYGNDLPLFPILRDTMFTDRAAQFKARLGWAVDVDASGWERDRYDALNPLYVIWQRPDGRHGGSMRFLPTLGPTMVSDHFTHLLGGRQIAHRRVWECTRFCLAEGGAPNLSAALMLGGAELGTSLGLSRAVGVFDARMVRIYRHLGWQPNILGSASGAEGDISLGMWEFSDEVRRRLARRAGIAPELSRLWFDRSLGQVDPLSEAG